MEFHYTPKHGSWLNMAEIELSVLARQCLDRRILEQTTLQQEVAAWEKEEISSLAPLTGSLPRQMRIKLKRLYPSILP